MPLTTTSRRAAAALPRAAALLFLGLCAGCASDDPMWETIRGDWSVFTGAPAWIEREFERSGEELAQDGRWIGDHLHRNVEATRALPEDLRALAEEDLRRSEEGLSYQGGVLRRSFQQNVESFEREILGSPAWVGREFDRSGQELGKDVDRIADRIERQAEEFWPEVKRYLRVLLR